MSTRRAHYESDRRTAPADLRSIALEAYIYTVPLVIMNNFRFNRTAGKRMNVFLHARKLLNHRSRAITAPNNDTLYSDAWLDLTQGPVTITIPSTSHRYFSLAFMDMYGNNFSIVGTRTTGGDGGTFTVIGPNDSAECVGTNVLRAPTPYVCALARLLVDGPADLDAARELQSGLLLDAPAQPEVPTIPVTARNAPWDEYFAGANALLSLHRPPVTDLAVLKRIRALGTGPSIKFDSTRFTRDDVKQIESGVADARQMLVDAQGKLGEPVGGWVYPQPNNGNFGQDYFYRAATAVGTLAALPVEEATYLRPVGENGDGLYDGRKLWRMHFPAGEPLPVDSFWSLSMYEPTEQGEFFFVDNPLHRYAIGDRTPGLRLTDDGSLTIWLGHERPGKDRESNWLPAPAGPFYLILRAYLPRKEMQFGQYRVPAPMAVEG